LKNKWASESKGTEAVTDEAPSKEKTEKQKKKEKELAEKKLEKLRKLGLSTEGELLKSKNMFKDFFKNSNKEESLEDTINVRVNHFLDEYISDLLQRHEDEVNLVKTKKYYPTNKINYNFKEDVKNFEFFKFRREQLFEGMKAELLVEGILNKKYMEEYLNDIVLGKLMKGEQYKQKRIDMLVQKARRRFMGLLKKNQLE